MMSKVSSLLLGTVAVLLTASYALASPTVVPIRRHQAQPEPDAQETGVIAAVDQESRKITLVDGHSFKVPAWISFDHLATGAMISITYTPDPHHDTTDVKTISVI